MSIDTPGNRLRAKLDMAYPALSAHAERIWSSPLIDKLYPAYLATMHTIVRSAVPLMECALEQARARSADDEVAAGLVNYLHHHIGEETGHDAWLLEDLAETGSDPGEPWRQIPSARVAALVGAQYYWVRHHHPVSLLGHIAVIEGNHPPAGFAKRLRSLTQYPEGAFRAISRHEILDVGHKRELYELIDRLPLNRAHEKMLSVSALHTIEAGIEVFNGIYENGVTSVPSHASEF